MAFGPTRHRAWIGGAEVRRYTPDTCSSYPLQDMVVAWDLLSSASRSRCYRAHCYVHALLCNRASLTIGIHEPGAPISRHRGGQEARGRGIGFRGPDLPGGSVFEARGTENGVQKHICRIAAFIENPQSKIEISLQKPSPQRNEP